MHRVKRAMLRRRKRRRRRRRGRGTALPAMQPRLRRRRPRASITIPTTMMRANRWCAAPPSSARARNPASKSTAASAAAVAAVADAARSGAAAQSGVLGQPGPLPDRHIIRVDGEGGAQPTGENCAAAAEPRARAVESARRARSRSNRRRRASRLRGEEVRARRAVTPPRPPRARRPAASAPIEAVEVKALPAPARKKARAPRHDDAPTTRRPLAKTRPRRRASPRRPRAAPRARPRKRPRAKPARRRKRPRKKTQRVIWRLSRSSSISTGRSPMSTRSTRWSVPSPATTRGTRSTASCVAGEITLREALRAASSRSCGSRVPETLAFMEAHAHVDPAFGAVRRAVRAHGGAIRVVSSGIATVIHDALARAGVEIDVLANDVDFASRRLDDVVRRSVGQRTRQGRPRRATPARAARAPSTSATASATSRPRSTADERFAKTDRAPRSVLPRRAVSRVRRSTRSQRSNGACFPNALTAGPGWPRR